MAAPKSTRHSSHTQAAVPQIRKPHARLRYLSQVLDELHLFVSTTDLRSSQKDCDTLADSIAPAIREVSAKVEASLPPQLQLLRLTASIRRDLPAFLRQRRAMRRAKA